MPRNDEREQFEADVEGVWCKVTGGINPPQRYQEEHWVAVMNRLKMMYGDCEGGGGGGVDASESVAGGGGAGAGQGIKEEFPARAFKKCAAAPIACV